MLCLQAPQDSVVDRYIVHIKWLYDNRTIEVDGTSTGLNISDLSENIEYMFAVQAINDGGSGNTTSYRSGAFCFTSEAPYNLHINFT